jgi:plastocyanin
VGGVPVWLGIIALMVAVTAHAYEAGPVSDGGTVAGTIRYAGLPPSRGTLAVTKDVAVCGQTAKLAAELVVGADGGLRNAVVRLRNIVAGKPFGAASPTLDQRGCEYAPHVVLVPVGRPLTILNPDGILHNIRTAGQPPATEINRPRNRAQPKFKTSMTEVFEQPEFIRVSCDVHRWMQAWIVVEAHPYYAVTDAAGHFALSEVPAGTYELSIWHETLGETVRPVTVSPGGRAEIDATLGPR